jgi:hypothetical protein
MGMDERTVFIPFNNPTAVTLAGLSGPPLEKGPLLDSFLEAGGVPALVQLLGGSTCRLTVVYTAALIHSMLLETRVGPSGTLGLSSARPERASEVCHRFRQSGEKRHMARKGSMYSEV